MDQIAWKYKTGRKVPTDIWSDEVLYLSFPILEQTGLVANGFATRIGGVSKGKFATMNLSFTRGDDPECVTENYRRIAKALGVDVNRIVLSYQTHTTNVRKVTENDMGKGIFVKRDYRDVDGLITNIPGITLATFYADCVPLYFLDPVHKCIGLSHSGWRGTVNRMGKATLEALAREYGTKPEDVICCIGPSICQDCYEVGIEVVEEFQKHFDASWWSELYDRKDNGKYQLNLWRANEIILQDAGVLPEHIQTTDICTRCNSEYLFSHRVSGNERGNLAAFLCLKQKSD